MDELGQVAYEAYVRAYAGPPFQPASWQDQPPEIRAYWNAAAQAVADYLDRVPHG